MTPLKANTFISFILLLVLLLLSGEAFSQRRRGRTVPTGSERTDTFNIEGVQRGDTLLKGDTLQNDTIQLQPAGKKKQPLDAPVIYEATDSIVFTQNGIANLYGDGKVNYQKIELAAEVITMNMDSSTVFAHGVEDSLKVIKGRPVFLL